MEGITWSEIRADRMHLSVIHHPPGAAARQAGEEKQELAARISRIFREAGEEDV